MENIRDIAFDPITGNPTITFADDTVKVYAEVVAAGSPQTVNLVAGQSVTVIAA